MSEESRAWQAVTREIVETQLPGHSLAIVLDSETGELEHISIRVRTLGELARWVVALNGRGTRHEHGGREWTDVYGDVDGYTVHVSTDHRSVAS